MKRLLILALVLVVLVSAIPAIPAGAQTSNVNVRVGFFPNLTHSQALLGRADKSFQTAIGDSNKLDWKEFNAGPAEIEALFAGQIDIGYIGPGPAINGFVKSKGALQIIAGATNAGAILVSRKDLKIKSVKELSGKKVAIPQFGNTQDLSLRNLLKENGLKETTKGGTVSVIAAENPDIKTLMDKGTIDAALVPEPWGTRLIKEIGANLVLDYKGIWKNGDYATAVVIARTDFIKQNPEIVEKFLSNHVKLTKYITGNVKQVKPILNAQIKELTGKDLAADVLDESFARLSITYDPNSSSVKGFGTLSWKAGFLKEAPKLNNLFNYNILNKILKEQNLKQVK